MKGVIKNIVMAFAVAFVVAPWVVMLIDLFFWMFTGNLFVSHTLGIDYSNTRLTVMTVWPIALSIPVGYIVSTL